MIGIVFVAFRLHTYWLELDLSRISPLAWGLIAASALLYGLANSLLAMAWWHLLRHLGTSPSRLGAIRIYGVSQLAKYVPGNIFHLAGRQALGMSSGLSAVALAKSTVWELGLIATAGSLFCWLILPIVNNSFHTTSSVFLLISSAVLVAASLDRLVDRQTMWSFVWQMLFLVMSGSVFAALLYLIADGEGLTVQQWLTVGGAYIVAWLIGLVTPGAPAGVGVRELILLFILKNLVTESDLLTVVLVGRLVTVTGDFIFFLASSLIPAKHCNFKEIYGQQ